MRGGMRNPMPEQPADVRNKNFEEVALGYTAEMAMEPLLMKQSAACIARNRCA